MSSPSVGIPLKLLFVSTEFPPGPGGIGTHAFQIARQLAKLGWQVVVVTPQAYAEPEEVEAFNAAQDFEVVSLPQIPGRVRQTRARARTITHWVKSFHPDILLASGDPAVYAGAWVAWRHSQLAVAVEHGRVPPKWERPIKRWAFGGVAGVVAVSEFSLQRLLDLGVKPRSQQVIANGADDQFFRVLPEARILETKKSLGLEAARIVLTVGNVTKRKGQEIVIRSLPHILERVPDTHYLMAGLPTLESELQALAEQLGVQEHVHFLGRVDAERLLELYNCCDVFVMTSRHTAQEFEGYGIGVIEAALCGKTAVVSSSSGLAEAVVDGQTGLLVPLEDEVSTAGAIAHLLEDEDTRSRLADAAQHRAETERTWQHVTVEYQSFLEQLIERRMSRSC